jgi:hypothetical protein
MQPDPASHEVRVTGQGFALLVSRCSVGSPSKLSSWDNEHPKFREKLARHSE